MLKLNGCMDEVYAWYKILDIINLWTCGFAGSVMREKFYVYESACVPSNLPNSEVSFFEKKF